ncbi:sigma-54 interaction domain-containing protein [Pseudogracilibacillus auburnensis]|uniref:PAS domain S-box-containing protein n=1 Tax=Pseudogracilibacillus auburnensis TaxID=1494959 RepID=A0A2V3VLE1_9BACI|nr:sigma 54-interacting transcriptional regulator [Pseudogracilibacillus auburnensis]MBO1002526.1 sigma 54-interacting transcriptional regulator [Pseudogracilibacillus auburnensis]PXW82632.1 PAS domain S-box-containing protein [Pseudogracilibacillus auburnensis]
MNFSTTTIESIVNRSFQLIEEEINVSKRKEYFNDLEKLFFLKNGTPFIVHIQNSTNTYSTTPVKAISGKCQLNKAVNILGNDQIALVENEENEYIGYITHKIIAEQLLIEYGKLEAYLETILDNIEDSCTAIDKNSNVVCWTKGAEKLFSINKDEILGQPITNYFTRENLEILNALHNGESVYRHQHHARNDLVVLINSSPVVYQETIIGAVVTETDITNLIRLNNELYKTTEKLFNLEEVVRKSSASSNPFSYIKGNSTPLQTTINLAKKAAKTDASVLIYGESGVGKELFAKAIHHLRETETAPFVAINCGAISSSLFESEIFGYEKGAFSGADAKGKKGKAELARGGTLFLDEIGEMPLEMQVKFLRLLQEKRFYRVGGTKEIEVDFRVIAATNRDLKELIQKGDFREDLYYRLNVVHFTVPPLRERPQDIIELTHYFLHEMSIKYNRPIHGISQDVMQSLLNHSWSGNTRELKNVIERMIVFSDNGEIKRDDLPIELEKIDPVSSLVSIKDHSNDMYQLSLNDQLQVFEKEIILRELKRSSGNKLQCAKALGVTRATLYNRMNKLNIDY